MNLLYFWTGGGIAWAGGSTATIGVSAQSGRFAGLWTGSTATVGAASITTDIWITRQKWVGSLAVVGVNAEGGVFAGIGHAHGRTTMSIVGRTRTETRLPKHRTAMMVTKGSSRTGER